MRKVKKNRILCLALAICAVFAISMTAPVPGAAAASAAPDYSRTGSVTVDILSTETGKAIPGGTMTLYKVAAAQETDGENGFKAVGLFRESGISLDTVGESDPGARELADSLEAYVSRKKIAGTSAVIDENGQARWTGLELGLYLVVHTTPAKGYDAVHSFLITVPRYLNGAYVYDVKAAPKAGTANTSVSKTSASSSGSGSSAGRLPQTGQLWWPVPVLAFAGLLFVMLGWHRRYCPGGRGHAR
ncbi:MAG: SpaA isopeptide-forming pilin-related protein [Lachnospiraceae bacterium]|nr:SpaA isopeptide-forming pilin-related protein [Lachnospiraceae bacterium]